MRKAQQYLREVRGYWRLAESATDFLKIMQVRLARSKIGGLVCPYPKTVVVRMHGFADHIFLRTHTTDISVFNEVALWQGYSSVTRFVTGSPRLIVDLGANVGVVALWFESQFEQAFIVAVEPEAGNAAILRRNLEAAARPHRVIEACVGGNERLVRLDLSRGEFGFRMAEGSELGDAAVPVVTMQTVLEPTGDADIDILKCDIEGAEVELFENCSSWIRRVNLLVAELHGGYAAGDLMDAIKRNGGEMQLLERVVSTPWNSETVILKRLRSGVVTTDKTSLSAELITGALRPTGREP